MQEANAINLVIEGKATTKERPRLGVYCAYTPKKTKKHEQWIALNARHQLPGFTPLTCPVVMHLTINKEAPISWSKKKRQHALHGALFPISRGAGDVDNYAKAVCDALNKIVYADDVQIVDLHVYKRYAERSYTSIKIMPLPADMEAA